MEKFGSRSSEVEINGALLKVKRIWTSLWVLAIHHWAEGVMFVGFGLWVNWQMGIGLGQLVKKSYGVGLGQLVKSLMGCDWLS